MGRSYTFRPHRHTPLVVYGKGKPTKGTHEVMCSDFWWFVWGSFFSFFNCSPKLLSFSNFRIFRPCFPCMVAVQCTGDRRWRGGCIPSQGARLGHMRCSPANYCWTSFFLWRSFSSLLASQEGCVTSQHPAFSLESPGHSLGLASAGLMHYQPVFELKGTLILQLPLELSAACSQGFKRVVHVCILFNKMCIAY